MMHSHNVSCEQKLCMKCWLLFMEGALKQHRCRRPSQWTSPNPISMYENLGLSSEDIRYRIYVSGVTLIQKLILDVTAELQSWRCLVLDLISVIDRDTPDCEKSHSGPYSTSYLCCIGSFIYTKQPFMLISSHALILFELFCISHRWLCSETHVLGERPL